MRVEAGRYKLEFQGRATYQGTAFILCVFVIHGFQNNKNTVTFKQNLNTKKWLIT